jgi:predicted DCC family thiol-disulfide oxidoreductase YuxK
MRPPVDGRAKHEQCGERPGGWTTAQADTTTLSLADDVKAMAAGRPIIVFDAECVLCSGFIGFVIERDRSGIYAFASAQGPAGQALLAAHGMPLADWESNVLFRGGEIHLKSRAFIEIMAALGGPWRLVRFAKVLPRAPLDWIYDRVAQNRYRWFGKRTCLVPTPDIRARFL